jgi:hypothetical protein
VVDFQQTPKPRNYLARREQWRLLLLVLSLGLVVILMNEARKPRNWLWLTDAGGGRGDLHVARGSSEGPPIDTRLNPVPRQAEIPGTFTSDAPTLVEAEEDTSGRYFPGVKPKYLELVRDDTTFLHDERHAWFNLLDILDKTDEATLRRESIDRVTFAQLFKQSGDYRGQLVSVGGTIRRVNPVGAAPNDVGIRRLYRTWLFPHDNPSSPIVAYCLRLPKGFPTGMNLVEEAEITGFFFKRWAYNAWDPGRKETTLRTAPTMVVRTIHWRKSPLPEKETPADAGTLLVAIGAALAVGLFTAVYVYRRTRTSRPEEAGTPLNLDALRDVDVSPDQPGSKP